MESQPQNREFRFNPDNFHPCTKSIPRACVRNEVAFVSLACEDVRKERSGLSTLGLLRCA